MRGANEAALESGIIQHSGSDAESAEAAGSSSKVSVPGQVSPLLNYGANYTVHVQGVK